ncbi:hypothetical protein JYK22_21330, partial [Nonomuraea sp. RK-328]|nr:hypothetical protein [Nonomuraea sp. RK-328]
MTAGDGDIKAIQADFHAALSEVINRHEPSKAYLTRFVVLAEVVDGEGERMVWQVAADGMRAWDTLGLLDYARSVEYAGVVREEE